jgi:hypothetical protein
VNAINGSGVALVEMLAHLKMNVVVLKRVDKNGLVTEWTVKHTFEST